MFSRAVDVFVADLSAIEIDESVLSVAELGHSLDIAMSDELPEYLAAHTWLRRRLADYLGIPAEAIDFGIGENGEPTVTTPATDLEFSLAYTDWSAILAVAFRQRLGVDVRAVTGAELQPGDIARTLAPVEMQRYNDSLSPIRTFLQFMVRKEALRKVTRNGNPDDPRQLDVSGLSPVAVDEHVVTDINLGDGFVGAVAAPPGLTINLTIDTTADGAAFSFAAAAV